MTGLQNFSRLKYREVLQELWPGWLRLLICLLAIDMFTCYWSVYMLLVCLHAIDLLTCYWSAYMLLMICLYAIDLLTCYWCARLSRHSACYEQSHRFFVFESQALCEWTPESQDWGWTALCSLAPHFLTCLPRHRARSTSVSIAPPFQPVCTLLCLPGFNSWQHLEYKRQSLSSFCLWGCLYFTLDVWGDHHGITDDSVDTSTSRPRRDDSFLWGYLCFTLDAWDDHHGITDASVDTSTSRLRRDSPTLGPHSWGALCFPGYQT